MFDERIFRPKDNTMDAGPESSAEAPAGRGADPSPRMTPDLSEALRRRQIAMSRWENEGGSVAAPAPRS